MKFKNFVFGLGIFIVYALALFQGLETFYPTPQYDKYCPTRAYPPVLYKDTTDASCPTIPGLKDLADDCNYAKGDFVFEYDSNNCPISGFCDPCRIKYEADLDVHSNRVFIISIIIGIFVFVAGLFLLATEPVGSALMSGGIWSVFYGVVNNWRNFSNSWRFLLLFVLLVVLIWLALRFNRKSSGFDKLKRKFRR